MESSHPNNSADNFSGKLNEEQAREWAIVLRDLIKHENGLVNQRITWLVQAQSLLFAALAFAWKDAPLPFLLLIAFVGFGSTISIWTAISLYSEAVRGINQEWAERKPLDYGGPPISGLTRPSKGIVKLLRPWRALPFIFSIAWLFTAVIGFWSRMA